MSTPYRYRPGEIEVSSDDIFGNDKLDRAPFVSAATDLLKSIQEPFVIALDAPWGSGKTTTFRMLKRQLESEGIVTVSFNAWEVDYATDPLVPLVATLHDRLLNLKGYGKDIDSSKVEKWKTLGGILAKNVAVAGVKAATAGLIDVSGLAEGVGKAITAAADNAGEGLSGDLIDYFKQEKQAASQFKDLLEELTNFVRRSSKEGEQPPPVVLMIDELDRCRPTFAVAMLERIKHFFSIQGLVFVLALDMKQLKASTQSIYGANMDASEYLRRFVDLELHLPRADASKMIDSMLSNCGADAFFDARSNHHELQYDRTHIVETLQELTSTFELPPRVVQRIVSRVILLIRQSRPNQYLDGPLVAFLVFLRVKMPDLYRKIFAGHISPNEAIRAVQLAVPSNRDFYNSRTAWLIEAFLLNSSLNNYREQSENHRKQFFRELESLKEHPNKPEGSRMSQVSDYFVSIRDSQRVRGHIRLDGIDERINLVAEDVDRTR